ncbi:MAG TPA: hypothetical protein VGU46_06070 [Acidobacteriaceae bacterium]|nr:hypothetical protein [Acidobacteriaceae bacterium]
MTRGGGGVWVGVGGFGGEGAPGLVEDGVGDEGLVGCGDGFGDRGCGAGGIGGCGGGSSSGVLRRAKLWVVGAGLAGEGGGGDAESFEEVVGSLDVEVVGGDAGG